MRRVPFALTVTTALLTSAFTAAAQRPIAQLTMGGGSATDVRGVRSDAVTAAPMLAFAWPRGAVLRLGATGTGFSTGGWTLGAGASSHLRSPLASIPLALTFEAAASMTTTSYHTSFATIGATPAVELGLSRFTLFAGVRTARARTALERTVLPTQPPSSSTVARSAIGPVFGGQLAVATFGNGDRVSVGYREEHARIDEMNVTDRAGTVSLVRGPVALSGVLGIRRSPDEATTFSGISASFALSRVAALQVSAERYAGDRLTGALGGQAINAGFVFRTPSGPRPLPRPRGVSAPVRGLTRLAIRAPAARTVEVAGDWTDWQPIAATRAPNGVWYVDQAIPPGEYRYAFRIDGTQWRIPDGAVAVDDGIGGKSAWLTVSRAAK